VFAVLRGLIEFPRPGAPTLPNSLSSTQFRGANHAPGSGGISFWETEQTEFGDRNSVYRQFEQASTHATVGFVRQVGSDRHTAVKWQTFIKMLIAPKEERRFLDHVFLTRTAYHDYTSGVVK
jgi:hypothetical protein